LRSTKKYTKAEKKMDKYDRAMNMTFFVCDCLAVYRCYQDNKYLSAAVFAILGLWFLKNELLYGRG
jgi:uncharacterized membrane protein YkvA (DUF1232 family)